MQRPRASRLALALLTVLKIAFMIPWEGKLGLAEVVQFDGNEVRIRDDLVSLCK